MREGDKEGGGKRKEDVEGRTRREEGSRKEEAEGRRDGEKVPEKFQLPIFNFFSRIRIFRQTRAFTNSRPELLRK
jgi:hypothetical protein